jgi:hypothetical protein
MVIVTSSRECRPEAPFFCIVHRAPCPEPTSLGIVTYGTLWSHRERCYAWHNVVATTACRWSFVQSVGSKQPFLICRHLISGETLVINSSLRLRVSDPFINGCERTCNFCIKSSSRALDPTSFPSLPVCVSSAITIPTRCVHVA